MNELTNEFNNNNNNNFEENEFEKLICLYNYHNYPHIIKIFIKILKKY